MAGGDLFKAHHLGEPQSRQELPCPSPREDFLVEDGVLLRVGCVVQVGFDAIADLLVGVERRVMVTQLMSEETQLLEQVARAGGELIPFCLW